MLSPFNRWENKVLQCYLLRFPQSSSKQNWAWGFGSQLWLMLCSERDSLVSIPRHTCSGDSPLDIESCPVTSFQVTVLDSSFSIFLWPTRSSAQEMSDETLNRNVPPGQSSGKDSALPWLRAWVQPLQELRSHKPCGLRIQTNKQKD